MAFALRRVLSIAVGVASSNLLAVEAGGAEMLVKPDMEIHQSLQRMLKGEEDMNTTTTQTQESETTTSEAEDNMTTSEEEDAAPASKAVITGTASLSVANATEFCANDAALEVIEQVMKEATEAADVVVECAVNERRLNEGSARRLDESVTLMYTITVEADDESSAEVLSVTDKIEALTAATLTTMIEEGLAAANIDVEVTVLELSAPSVEIETPTTTSVVAPTDASSGLSASVGSLIAATAISFALHM